MALISRADDNKNGFLDTEELAQWIQMKVSEHITVGVKTNFKVFLLLDKNPKDGESLTDALVAYIQVKICLN